MFSSQRALMLFDRQRNQFVIQLYPWRIVSASFQSSAVRIQRICELMMAFIGVRVRLLRRAQQRKPQHVAFGVISVLAIVEQAESVLASEISAQRCAGTSNCACSAGVLRVVGRCTEPNGISYVALSL